MDKKVLEHFFSLPSEVKQEISFCFNSNDYRGEDIFFALKGERFNAFKFCESVINQGCKLVIYEWQGQSDEENHIKKKYPDVSFLKVKDSIKFLQTLAYHHIQEWQKNDHKKVISISGSNGKTTTKEMLFFVLNAVYPQKVHATRGNNNNHIGVPQTLLEANSTHDFLIVELGSNHPGEIKQLCDITCPNISLVTNIGKTHLEFFGSVENVFLEETYPYLYLSKSKKSSKFFLQNIDDPWISKLDKKDFCFSYSHLNSNADMSIELDLDCMQIVIKNKSYKVNTSHLTGKHNQINMALVLMTCYLINAEKMDRCISQQAYFKSTSNRSEWIELGKTRIFLDAYNANPSSMVSSLEAFFQKIHHEYAQSLLVIGDMNELGDSTEREHCELAKGLSRYKPQQVFFVGKYAHYYQSGYKGNCEVFSNVDELLKKYPTLFEQYRFIFIKGSRSVKLEKLVKGLGK